MNMKQAFLPFALSAALVASADITGLPDLTDDLDNRTSVSGNDNINDKQSNGAYAFNISAATQTAVNKDDSRFGGGGTSGNPLWVVYEFRTNTVVNAYRIWNQATGFFQKERSPKDFYFEGSPDGSAWVTLDNRTNQKAWSAGEPRVFEFDNRTAYKFYRMSFTANIGGADGYIMIQELEYFCRPQLAHSLTIEGIPANYGEPSLRYGTHKAAEGEVFEISVETPVELIAERQRAGCIGWATSVRDAEDETVWNELDAGAGNAVSFAHPGGAAKLVWKFAISNMIEAVSHGGGTVSGGGWCLQDESLTLKATAGEGYDFIRWIGDTTGIDDSTAAEITVVADAPRKMTAFFVPKGGARVIYVSTDGDDGNDGTSLDKAKASVGAAVAYLDQTYMEGTVFVAPGIYEQSKQTVLSNAIEIVGMTGKPKDVILRNNATAAWDNKECRVFHLRNAKALVTGLTIEKGSVYNVMGGNLLISADGGSVSNCVIASGHGSMNTKGANAALDAANGVITHCVISNGALSAHTGESSGTAVFFSGNGGRLSNCLITRNAFASDERQKATAPSVSMSVVCLNNGVMDNCTIVDNCHTGLTAGVYAKSDGKNLRVVNCVIAGNTELDGSKVPAYYGNGAAKFANCVTDDEKPINATCKVGIADEMFVNPDDGKWQPLPDGSLADAGTTNNLAVPSVDLKGNPRIRGEAIDLGCYEVSSAGFFIRVR